MLPHRHPRSHSLPWIHSLDTSFFKDDSLPMLTDVDCMLDRPQLQLLQPQLTVRSTLSWFCISVLSRNQRSNRMRLLANFREN